MVGGSIAYLKRVDILLAMAKYKTSQKYADIGPTPELPWQQGPATSNQAAADRPPNIIPIGLAVPTVSLTWKRGPG